MRYFNVFIVMITGFTVSCNPDNVGIDNKYNTGTFPDVPVNMSSINSEYDDYNSTSPILGNTSPLCFSSKRNSQGYPPYQTHL